MEGGQGAALCSLASVCTHLGTRNNIQDYANKKDILLVGDMPIYVGGHSSDVWANQGLFSLSDDGQPVLVSGVPPDAFSDTGQLWGSPLYDWEAHRSQQYAWWVQRLGRALKQCDEVRVDHFRGFAGYWAVEAWRENAMIGTWKAGPGEELFVALKQVRVVLWRVLLFCAALAGGMPSNTWVTAVPLKSHHCCRRWGVCPSWQRTWA